MDPTGQHPGAQEHLLCSLRVLLFSTGHWTYSAVSLSLRFLLWHDDGFYVSVLYEINERMCLEGKVL